MSGTPYLASEDSALFRQTLKGFSGGACLEIGAGNGGNLVELSNRFGLVVGTDLIRPAMPDWREVGANFVIADGAACLRPSAFDLVAFNPPYLAADVGGDKTVEGGRHLDVPKKFLKDGLNVVKREGTVVFLLNDEADPEEFEELTKENGFHLERVASQRLFFEELSVYKATSRA